MQEVPTMREILFRGKRIDNGEWVLGWYEPPVEWDGHKFGTTIAYICEEGYLEDAEVDPSTVGQFTGLTDKNGKRIFEGDIVDILTENEEIGVVTYDDGGFWVEADGFRVDFHTNINGTDLEVLYNIHDNPELLEGGNA